MGFFNSFSSTLSSLGVNQGNLMEDGFKVDENIVKNAKLGGMMSSEQAILLKDLIMRSASLNTVGNIEAQWGKYEGEKIKNIPPDYFSWFRDGRDARFSPWIELGIEYWGRCDRSAEKVIDGINEDELTELTEIEGYNLIQKYVDYFWCETFFSLKFDMEMGDIVNEIFVKLLERNYFEKYRSKRDGGTTKKHYIATAVKRAMIDMLRVQKDRVSLQQEDDNGISLMDRLKNEVSLDDLYKERDLLNIIDSLPDERRGSEEVWGESPILGKCKLCLRVVAIHLIAGFNGIEIANMFESPWSGKKLSPPTIYNMRDKIRECLQ